MPLVPALGATYVPQLVYIPDKDSYQCDRAGLFYDGHPYGDQGVGVKGEGCHLFAYEPMGDKFLTVSDDATLLKQIQPDDFGINGRENIGAILVHGGDERGTFYAPQSQLHWLANLLKNLQVTIAGTANDVFIAQGERQPYQFNTGGEVRPA